MIKLNLQELVHALDLLKTTSTYEHAPFTQDGQSLHLKFTNTQGELVSIHLYDIETRKVATIQKTEKLVQSDK